MTTTNLQKGQRDTLNTMGKHQQNPDCRKLYRTKHLLSAIHEMQRNKEKMKRKNDRLKETRTYQPITMCEPYLDFFFFFGGTV
jgi:hypothetical protein